MIGAGLALLVIIFCWPIVCAVGSFVRFWLVSVTLVTLAVMAWRSVWGG